MTDAPVLTSEDGGVLTITLNRPEARNAVNRRSREGVAEALDASTPRTTCGSASSPARARRFCAGMDLKAFVTGERPWVGDRGFAGITQRAREKPLIAAVEGFALAGGFEVALSCDLIVAAP